MARTDHCPICDVAVKPENLIRHLGDTHPRHPDTRTLQEKFRERGRQAARKEARQPIHIRRWHVALTVGLVVLISSGYLVAPYFDPYRNFGPDSCINEVNVPNYPPYHMHPYLTIIALGTPQLVPGDVGITATCMHPIHVHGGSDAQGRVQLHVESPVVHTFYLRDFFHIWGEPFNQNQILQYTADGTNRIRMTVNGTASSAYENLALWDGQEIVISYGP